MSNRKLSLTHWSSLIIIWILASLPWMFSCHYSNSVLQCGDGLLGDASIWTSSLQRNEQTQSTFSSHGHESSLDGRHASAPMLEWSHHPYGLLFRRIAHLRRWRGRLHHHLVRPTFNSLLSFIFWNFLKIFNSCFFFVFYFWIRSTLKFAQLWNALHAVSQWNQRERFCGWKKFRCDGKRRQYGKTDLRPRDLSHQDSKLKKKTFSLE